jgi:hypothetical protein
MAWLHTSGSLVSGKAWDDNGIRTVEQCRKRLNPKGYVRFPDHAPVPIVWPLFLRPELSGSGSRWGPTVTYAEEPEVSDALVIARSL